jgi:hypothetical protein
MHTNLYLVEKLDRQRRQDFLNQATRDGICGQLPKTRRSLAEYLRHHLSHLQLTLKRRMSVGMQHERNGQAF